MQSFLRSAPHLSKLLQWQHFFRSLHLFWGQSIWLEHASVRQIYRLWIYGLFMRKLLSERAVHGSVLEMTPPLQEHLSLLRLTGENLCGCAVCWCGNYRKNVSWTQSDLSHLTQMVRSQSQFWHWGQLLIVLSPGWHSKINMYSNFATRKTLRLYHFIALIRRTELICPVAHGSTFYISDTAFSMRICLTGFSANSQWHCMCKPLSIGFVLNQLCDPTLDHRKLLFFPFCMTDNAPRISDKCFHC